MPIRLVVGARALTVRLDDNASARDFAALLPRSFTLEDYGDTEKIVMLPRRLSTDGAPAGCTPVAGDFSYYSPWGNLAIFLKPFLHSAGLVRLGRIEGDLQVLRTPGRLEVRIEEMS